MRSPGDCTSWRTCRRATTRVRRAIPSSTSCTGFRRAHRISRRRLRRAGARRDGEPGDPRRAAGLDRQQDRSRVSRPGPGNRWDTAITRELVATVDSRFRTIRVAHGTRARRRVRRRVRRDASRARASGPVRGRRVVERLFPSDRPDRDEGRSTSARRKRMPTPNVHRQMQSSRAALKALKPFIAFYVGRDDTRFRAENQQLNHELSRAGIPHVFRLYPGGHDQRLWQTYAAPWLSLALAHLDPATGLDTIRRWRRPRSRRRSTRATSSRSTRCSTTRSGRSATPCASSCATASSPTSASGSSRASCRASSCRRSAQLGLFGMHLEGYGLPGASAVAYGLACLELEAGDSGMRSLVSVQGSLAMFAIWRWGSEEQKQRWLPPMHEGEAIGCFGLTEPDAGSDPGSMRTTREARRLRLDPERLEDVDHERHGRRRRRRVGAHRGRARSTASSSRRACPDSRRPR